MSINITEYVLKHGNELFDYLPFNDVDALIFAQLAYSHWEVIAPTFDNFDAKPLAIRNITLEMNNKINRGEFDSIEARSLFKALITAERYKNVKVQYVLKHDDLRSNKQFYAVTFTLPSGITIISFRGTDFTLNGWKEDAMLSFEEKVSSQKAAVDYVEKIMGTREGKFYIVGHSKGGNLSYYSAIFMHRDFKKRLIKAYSFDGPGFNDKALFQKYAYTSIKSKLVRYLPQDDVVGVLLHLDDSPIILKSRGVGVIQHNPFLWQIGDNNNFVILNKRTHTSKIFEKSMDNFLETLTNQEKKDIVDAIFTLAGEDANVIDMAKHIPTTTRRFMVAYKDMPSDRKKQLFNNFMKFLGIVASTTVSYVKDK